MKISIPPPLLLFCFDWYGWRLRLHYTQSHREFIHMILPFHISLFSSKKYSCKSNNLNKNASLLKCLWVYKSFSQYLKQSVFHNIFFWFLLFNSFLFFSVSFVCFFSKCKDDFFYPVYELSCTKTGYIFRFNPTYSSTQPIVAFHGATICLYFILKMIVISVVNFNENCLKRFPTHWFQIVVIVILSNDVTIFLMVKKESTSQDTYSFRTYSSK